MTKFSCLGLAILFFCNGCNSNATDNEDRLSFLEASELLVGDAPTDYQTNLNPSPVIQKTHPRLMFNRSQIDAIRTKLVAPVYANDLQFLKTSAARTKYGGASTQAFRWQIFGDTEARDWAKRQLLEGKIDKWGYPFSDNQWLFAWATTYDWMSDSLSPEEKALAWSRVKPRLGGNFSSFETDKFAKPFEMNHNDTWGKEKYPYEAAVAIAIAGDGVDDQLADYVIAKTAAGHESFMAPGRMLDWLNIMALDSGGTQAAHDDDNVSGYSGMYAFPCMLFHGYWESATGEKIWDRSNFFRYFPLWNTYDNDTPLKADGQAIMEVVAGQYQDSAPEMSALAAWYLNEFGVEETSSTMLLPRLIWGDKRIQPKSPAELGLPLATHLRGADCFVSRSSWTRDATVVNVATRTIDQLRFEPVPGVVSIYRSKSPILVDTRKGKWSRKPVTASGVQLGKGVGSMYWKPPLQYQGKFERPQSPTAVVSAPAYYSNCVESQAINETYHSVTVKYDHLSLDRGIEQARRSVIHVFQEPEFVVVVDQWECGSKLDSLINWRLAAVPTNIDDRSFVWPGAAASVVHTGNGNLKWVGGVGHEFDRLDGSWAGDKKSGFKPGFGSSLSRVSKMGIGNVYLAGKGSDQVVTVIAIGATNPPEVETQDNRFSFAGIQLELESDGQFKLSRDQAKPQ